MTDRLPLFGQVRTRRDINRSAKQPPQAHPARPHRPAAGALEALQEEALHDEALIGPYIEEAIRRITGD